MKTMFQLHVHTVYMELKPDLQNTFRLLFLSFPIKERLQHSQSTAIFCDILLTIERYNKIH